MTRIVLLKRLAFCAALIPAAQLAYRAYTGSLTANPIEYIIHQTGDAAVMLLVITLVVTPLRRLSGWNELIQLRRMLGLFAFFYGSLHLFTWAVVDKYFDVSTMVQDVFERPFITIGMVTYLLLLPLAITSTKGWIRRLGRKWQQLHRLVYVAATTAVIHFWWGVKADIREPRLWALALSVLFGFRLWSMLRARALSRS